MPSSCSNTGSFNMYLVAFVAVVRLASSVEQTVSLGSDSSVSVLLGFSPLPHYGGGAKSRAQSQWRQAPRLRLVPPTALLWVRRMRRRPRRCGGLPPWSAKAAQPLKGARLSVRPAPAARESGRAKALCFFCGVAQSASAWQSMGVSVGAYKVGHFSAMKFTFAKFSFIALKCPKHINHPKILYIHF